MFHGSVGPWLVSQASSFLVGLSSGENGEVWDDSFISSLVSTAMSLPVVQDGPTVATLLPGDFGQCS